MIVLFTDFGVHDFYIGQIHAVLAREAPGTRIVDLLHSAPDFDVRVSAYLLPILAAQFPSRSVILGAVNQGRGDDAVVMLEADGRWYVGPDNGLFHMVQRRSINATVWTVQWRPSDIAPTFHGRDLYAPVAARLARGEWPEAVAGELTAPAAAWPDDLLAVIYIDHYGNAITGLRVSQVTRATKFVVNGQPLAFAPVYSAVPKGQPFWYENADGLVEIAANQGSAADVLGLRIGTELQRVS